MTIEQELRNLQELHESGAITDIELAQRKELLLSTPSPSTAMATSGATEKETRQWAMMLHLSQFAGYVIPLAGLIAPIVIWQVKKDQLPEIDAHGKVVANWMLTGLIYAIISVILLFLLIGIPMLIALGIMAIAFPIIGGIKANNGELWKYPMSIQFFK